MSKFLSMFVGILFFHGVCFAQESPFKIMQHTPLKAVQQLEHMQEVASYTGDMLVEKKVFTPAQGNLYVLVKITVLENNAQGVLFNPKEIRLIVDEKRYAPVQDDFFLTELMLDSFPKARIKKGRHTGYLVFEIQNKPYANMFLFYPDIRIEEDQ